MLVGAGPEGVQGAGAGAGARTTDDEIQSGW